MNETKWVWFFMVYLMMGITISYLAWYLDNKALILSGGFISLFGLGMAFKTSSILDDW